MALDPLALQAALVARLTSQITDVPVLDYVAPKQAYPFIRIEGLVATDDGTKTADLYEYAIQLSAFHKDITSRKPVYQLLKRMAAALHDQQAAMPMTGYQLVLIRLGYQEAFQQGGPDDTYYHGVQKYRALVQEL